MRDPFKNRTIEDLAMQYELLSGPNAPTKMYSAHQVYDEMLRRCDGDNLAVQVHLVGAKTILKMIDADGPA